VNALPIVSVTVEREHDVVGARQRARQLAELLGFDPQEQTRVATAVSEIARNAFTYAGGGRIEFALEGQTRPQILLIRVVDRGPGIEDLPLILAGQYRSATGLGLGIIGTKRLMDTFEVESAPGRGTTVSMRKFLSRRAPVVTAADVARITDGLARQRAHDPLAEVLEQNREMLRTLDELRRRQEELVRLNGELEDTNRGVVALYAEVDEQAGRLRRADELKSKFLSNMSHEFRTPLNSILALSRLLLDRLDGPLTGEQETQLHFIRKAANDLYELVNDLLDLAKVEAGKVVVRPVEFTAENLFGTLRGMLRPLLVNPALNLVFDDPGEVPPIQSDESKVSQILRNFISNALKFTERGEIRVSARVTDDGEHVVFAVADTGIGIAPEDQETIFEEFTQLDSGLQRRVRGTGLGLPLTRKLAELLGGEVGVVSTPGVGSTFSVTLPLAFAPALGSTATVGGPGADDVELSADPGRLPVLVLEDHQETILLYRKYVRETSFQLFVARSVREARQILAVVRPRAVVLDILLRGEDTWEFLAELKQDERTRDIPVLVVTEVDDRQKALALGADEFMQKPVDREAIVRALRELGGGGSGKRVLIIDDDDVSRYLLRTLLRDTTLLITEASDGAQGLEKARAERPDVIFCDLSMPTMDGAEVLQALADDPSTRAIPVVMNTVKKLTAEQRGDLERRAVAVLSKESFTRGDAMFEVRQALLKAGIRT
jgi:signal transduction histidine kinase/DNA-binding response OmpR family regulator